eukprot:6705497-Prymnesium_polylepis.1
MVDAARARGLVLMEAMHWYYHPFRERARAVVASGLVGAVRRIEVSVLITTPQSAKSVNASRYSLALGGGATLDTGSYALSCMVALLGDDELPRVTRSTATRWPTDPRVDEAMEAELTFARAAVAGSVRVSFVQGPAHIPESKAT